MDQGVPDLHHADYLIDFQWDENRLEVCDTDFFFFKFYFISRKECNLTHPRGHAGGRAGGGSCGEKTQVSGIK